jgi:hypothetical protein
MKTMLYTALLTLASIAPAHAERICNNCEYIYWGRYLGAHWVGDSSTFGNRDIVANFAEFYGTGNSRSFDDYWIVDLNETASVVLTITTKPGTPLPPFAPGAPTFTVEIYHDTGSVCDAIRCSISIPTLISTPLVSQETFDRRWTATTTLVPGRYAIRLAATTAPSGESAYTGTLRVKRP